MRLRRSRSRADGLGRNLAVWRAGTGARTFPRWLAQRTTTFTMAREATCQASDRAATISDEMIWRQATKTEAVGSSLEGEGAGSLLPARLWRHWCQLLPRTMAAPHLHPWLLRCRHWSSNSQNIPPAGASDSQRRQWGELVVIVNVVVVGVKGDPRHRQQWLRGTHNDVNGARRSQSAEHV